jgi:hypothetical protein
MVPLRFSYHSPELSTHPYSAFLTMVENRLERCEKKSNILEIKMKAINDSIENLESIAEKLEKEYYIIKH